MVKNKLSRFVISNSGASGLGKPRLEFFKLGFGDEWEKYYQKALVIYERELEKLLVACE